jgi:hypothetical protein
VSWRWGRREGSDNFIAGRSCYGLNAVFPKFICWKTIPKCDSNTRAGLQEVIRIRQGWTPSLFLPHADTRRSLQSTARNRFLPRTRPCAGSMLSATQPSEL